MSRQPQSFHGEYGDVRFVVYHRGIRAEAVLTCLRENALSGLVTAPEAMRGLPATCCHIPYFGLPGLRGYCWKGMLTLKALLCLRRSLMRAVDLHLLMARRGRQLRRRYRRHVKRMLAGYDGSRGPLYDCGEVARRRRELRRQLKAGVHSRRRHEEKMKKLKEGRTRYDLLVTEAQSRFRCETEKRFGLSPDEGEMRLLFTRYRPNGLAVAEDAQPLTSRVETPGSG